MNQMNKEQIIDKAYENYVNKIKLQNNWEITLRVMDINTIGQQELLSKEEFINKCKTNPEFSETWGLKIEERELSLEERAKWLQDNKEYDLLVGNLEHDHIREVVEDEAPTKLITLTYNNETIESYE